jgi:hypothetical protein
MHHFHFEKFLKLVLSNQTSVRLQIYGTHFEDLTTNEVLLKHSEETIIVRYHSKQMMGKN